MHQHLSMPARRTHHSLRRHVWLLTAALTVALFTWLAQSQPASAQSNCTAGRTQPVDRNGNGNTTDPNEIVPLDQCRQRTFDIGGTTKTVRVHFSTTSPVASDNLIAVDRDGNGSTEFSAVQIADEISRWTQEAWTIYRGYGFRDPMGRNDMNVHVFDMRGGLAGWCCGGDHYEINTPSVVPTFRMGGDTRSAESIAYHEMWHAAEYVGGFGCWSIEGTASNMTDHVNNPLDIFPSNDYIGRVRGYLQSGTERSLSSHCYDGALWWKYVMQETGTINSPLDQGVDAMLAFWRDAGATDFTRMDNIIRARRPGRTLESVWIDFAVANYAKEYGGPVVTPRYQYLDEAETPDYPAPRTNNFNLTATTGVPPTLTDAAAWSSTYYQFSIDAAVPFIDLQVRQDVNKRLGYVLLLMRNSEVVEEIRTVGRDFVQSFANRGYTRMVLIVVGLGEYANYRYLVNSTTPTLNIIDPLSSRQALAGRIDAPDKILVKVEVLSPSGGLPIAGIDPNIFTVTVGSRVVQPSDRISAAYVQGQYWLLMRAPTQTVSGDYNLRVDYASLTDTNNSAVRYQNRNDFDNVLVIDRSGSMDDYPGTQPLEAAKDAARLYANSWRETDQIGVVQFDDTAQVVLTLRPWTTTSRDEAHTAINALTPGGATCIGCGAQTGLDELIARGLGTHSWALIVLSDGKENVGAISTFITAYNARRNAGNQVPVVHTVALGPDADRARLEDLAAKTGGTYSFASIPAASVAAIQANELSNNLGEIYREIGEEVAGQQQVYNQVSVLEKLPFTHTIVVDGAASEAIFVLNSGAGLGGVIATLYDPNGVPHQPTHFDAPLDNVHAIWRIPSPEPGEWKMALFENIITVASVNQEVEYLIEAAVDSELTLDVFLGLPVEERLVGRPMPIFASLADSQPITGATMTAVVFPPTVGLHAVTLHDDGAHDDGAAGDGFYGGTFYQTHEWGSYDLIVIATGSADSGPFVRRQRMTFNMLDTRVLDDENIDPNAEPTDGNPDPNNTDTDDDGLPDWWEEENDLDPNSNDADEDPDQDGLTNEEEYEHSTDPHQSDTDGGGQNDGSEVNTQPTPLDPLDPSDDQVLCPYSFEAEAHIHGRDEPEHFDGVILLYDVAAEHKTVDIWRATNAEGPLQTIISQTVATGIYSDTTAVLNVPYYYWLTAYDEEGNASCVRGPAEITRTEDDIDPEGVVTINNGEAETNNVDATLGLNASPDTVEMQIRNDLNFDMEDGWEPYAPGKVWTLEPDGNSAFVFVLFRDGAGNISEPEFDSIMIASTFFNENIHLPQLGSNEEE